jgi:hypothetical protein
MKIASRFVWLGVALATFGLPVVGQSGSAPAQTPPTASKADTVQTIQQREENQQDRIAQGVKSGAISPEQAAQLKKNDARINNAVRNDLKANGGKLTSQEQAQVNHQLNRESRQIHSSMQGGGRRR